MEDLGYNRHRHRRFKRIEAGTIRTAGFRLPRVLTGVVPFRELNESAIVHLHSISSPTL